MEGVIKNSSDHSKNTSRTRNRAIIPCFLFFSLFIFLTIFPLLNSNSTTTTTTTATATATAKIPPPLIPNMKFIGSSLSLLSSDATAFRHLLEVSINHTINLVSVSHPEIINFFQTKELKTQEKIALDNCLDMLDQTLYELGQAIDDLLTSPVFSPIFFSNLKTLLSAAMTNEQTCIDGFLDLSKTRSGFESYLEKKLNPVIRMIGNSLAIIKHMEGKNTKMNQDSRVGFSFPPWMSRRDRRLMTVAGRRNRFRISVHMVVDQHGFGDFRTINEAVKMAPNMSLFRFVIKIRAGIYNENVEIPRNKVNIMLVGEGMNKTVITGSRSLADGFSTFNSATLAVIGDRFIARDLTIENTATPEKHQAVALRVTANAAFYRCKFTSYQDTLYAHSLVQLYRDCTIEGTIDFIFGNALAIFQNCQILARKPIPGQSNMITAQSRDDPYQNTGFLIHNCTIKASPGFPRVEQRQTYTFLGRPWRNYSRTIIVQSYLGSLIHHRGWAPWNLYSNLDTVEYVEYMNFGPGSNTKYRVRWGGYKKNYTEDVVKRRFTVGAFLRGSDYWFMKNTKAWSQA